MPHSSKMLGRPHIHERIPWASIIGALMGFGVGFFLTFGTQWFFYTIRVGGRPYTPIPTFNFAYCFLYFFSFVI